MKTMHKLACLLWICSIELCLEGCSCSHITCSAVRACGHSFLTPSPALLMGIFVGLSVLYFHLCYEKAPSHSWELKRILLPILLPRARLFSPRQYKMTSCSCIIYFPSPLMGICFVFKSPSISSVTHKQVLDVLLLSFSCLSA